MADWSRLPYDSLGSIVLKLDNIEDCACFGAVCHSFNDAYTMVKEMINQSGFIPWLLLAENTEDNPEYFRKLFNLCTNKCHQLRLPETFGKRCWGSSYGWLVTIGLDLEMYLFNPLTKAQICLPHLSTLPNYPEIDEDRTRHSLRKCYLTRAVILRIPDVFVVMVIYDEWRDVAFARPRDQVWTPVSRPTSHHIQGLKYTHWAHDFCYWDGKIVVIYGNGTLGCCDISSSSPQVRDLLPAPPGFLDHRTSDVYKLYVVNSNNELLIVGRLKDESDDNDSDNEGDYDDYETIEFKVFRLNFDSKEWKEIDNLGDVALFVGESNSMSINVLNSRNCVRNRIYFTDDEMQFWGLTKLFGGHDMGAFDIEGQDIIPYYEGGDIRSEFCTPLWFTPKI